MARRGRGGDRAIALAPLLGLAIGVAQAACFELPAYEGRTCSVDEACPAGFVCGLDGVCVARATYARRDAGAIEDDGGAASAGCGASDVPPRNGWSFTYHPILDDGSLDLATCLGEELEAGDESLDFRVASSTTAAAVRAKAATFGVLGHARPRFGGASSFTIDHDGPLRVRTGGLALYDGWTSSAATVHTRGYAHGEQSLVFELAATSSSARVHAEWSDECAEVAEPDAVSWRFRYYRVIVASLNPSVYVLDRTDCLGAELIAGAQFNRDFAYSSPAPVLTLGITDLFGAEITGPSRRFTAATRASIYHDDGFRLFVDGDVIYENWSSNQTTRTSVTIPTGTHELMMEWYENLGAAGVSIQW